MITTISVIQTLAGPVPRLYLWLDSICRKYIIILPFLLNLIVRRRVLPLIFSVYCVFFKFNFIVIRLRGSCSLLNVPQNTFLVCRFINWCLTCDMGQSIARYHLFRGTPSVHFPQMAMIYICSASPCVKHSSVNSWLLSFSVNICSFLLVKVIRYLQFLGCLWTGGYGCELITKYHMILRWYWEGVQIR